MNVAAWPFSPSLSFVSNLQVQNPQGNMTEDLQSPGSSKTAAP